MNRLNDKKIKKIIKVEKAYQLWYNKYLYKSTFVIPGIHIARNHLNEQEINDRLDEIKDVDATWKQIIFKNVLELFNANKEQILTFTKITEEERRNKKLFVRIQEPYVSIFSNTLETHKRLEKSFPDALYSISHPDSRMSEFLMQNKNSIIVDKLPHNRYRYKVIINNYSVKHSIPKQLLEWGDAQGDAVKFSSKTKRYFKSPVLYLDQGFLYIEDDSTLTMCNLFLAKCPYRIIKYVLDSEI